MLTHIFSAKIIRILFIESAKTVNEMTLNELVKLTTGPSCIQLNCTDYIEEWPSKVLFFHIICTVLFEYGKMAIIGHFFYLIYTIFVWIKIAAPKQKCIDYIEKWPEMIIFLYNPYIFLLGTTLLVSTIKLSYIWHHCIMRHFIKRFRHIYNIE